MGISICSPFVSHQIFAPIRLKQQWILPDNLPPAFEITTTTNRTSNTNKALTKPTSIANSRSSSSTTIAGPPLPPLNLNNPVQSSSSCPLAVQKNVGIYKDNTTNNNNNNPTTTKIANNKFDNVILLVACNYAYYELLQNWEYLAKQLDLKWAVLALDEELYDALGPTRAIYFDDSSSGGNTSQSYSVSGQQMYMKGNFNKLSCNKMKMVLDVMEHCGTGNNNNNSVDGVVFTDVDNIFYKDPFQHDFGRLVASGKYDYLYQDNFETPTQPLKATCLQQGKPPWQGNTGFYYIKGGRGRTPVDGMRRRPNPMIAIVEETLRKCFQPNNQLDDQTLFWEEFWSVMNNETNDSIIYHHCNVAEYLNPTTAADDDNAAAALGLSIINMCCLDPYYYPIGKCPQEQHYDWDDPMYDTCPPNNKDPITYHANWCYGKKEKIIKLHHSRIDGYGWPLHFCSSCLLGRRKTNTTCQQRANNLLAGNKNLTLEDAIQQTLHEQPINCNDQQHHNKQTRTIVTTATAAAAATDTRQ